MKFRPKFVDDKPRLIILVWVGLNTGLRLALEVIRPSTSNLSLAAGWLALFILGTGFILALRHIYWQLTPDCLIVRKLWRKKEILWGEVTEVGWLGPMSGTFRLSVGHRIEEYDRIYFEPSDQTGLADALRKFAPQANFDLEPFG